MCGTFSKKHCYPGTLWKICYSPPCTPKSPALICCRFAGSVHFYGLPHVKLHPASQRQATGNDNGALLTCRWPRSSWRLASFSCSTAARRLWVYTSSCILYSRKSWVRSWVAKSRSVCRAWARIVCQCNKQGGNVAHFEWQDFLVAPIPSNAVTYIICSQTSNQCRAAGFCESLMRRRI